MKISVYPLTLMLLTAAFSTITWSQSTQQSAQVSETNSLEFIRILETDDYFDSINLDGVVFPPYANSVLKIKGRSEGDASLELVVRGGKPGNTDNQLLTGVNSLVVTYDVGADDLYILDAASSELNVVKTNSSKNQIGSAVNGGGQASLAKFGLNNAQGIANDAATSNVYVLDRSGKRLITIAPSNDADISSLVGRLEQGAANELTLNAPSGAKLKGLAFNQVDGQLYTVNARTRELMTIDPNGDGGVRTIGTFSTEEWDEPVAIVFAASMDQTDDPERVHLFVASEVGRAGQVTEWYISGTSAR